jgi:hypothetical protein
MRDAFPTPATRASRLKDDADLVAVHLSHPAAVAAFERIRELALTRIDDRLAPPVEREWRAEAK